MRWIPDGCHRSENTSTSSRAGFARYCGTEYALAVSNGTTGLHLALATLGLQPGDEVIVPDLTFVATANAVAYTGATPVLADIDPDTLCIDPASVKSLIYGANQSDHSGSSLWSSGRYGRPFCHRRRPWFGRDRRCG